LKNYFFKKLAFSMLFIAILVCGTDKVYAASSSLNEFENEIALLSDEVPEELIGVVKGRMTYFDSILLYDEGIMSGNKSIGSPFSVYDDDADETYYYFPLYFNNEIIKTIFCFYDDTLGEWQTNMSGYLIEELTELFIEEQENNKKMGFLQKNADMYLINEDLSSSLFYDSPLSEDYVESNQLTWDNFEFQDLTEEYENTLIYTVPIVSEATERSLKSQGQNYLHLDFLENQGSNSWCAAYAATSIIRYHTKKSTPTAQQMMTSLYPNSSNLASESASNIQCIQYATNHGFHSISNRLGVATITETATEINANRPFWISALEQGSAIKKGRHAFVVRGYANFDFYQTISVWNPWSSANYGYDLMNPASQLISTHGTVWKQDSGLFSWHYK